MATPEITGLPGLLGMRDLDSTSGSATATMPVTADHLAPIGRLHAAAAIALADTLAGYGCLASLPPGADGFATTTITSHHVGTAAVGDLLRAEATLVHGGRSVQVWDVQVSRADGRLVATLRCQQQLLRQPSPDKITPGVHGGVAATPPPTGGCAGR